MSPHRDRAVGLTGARFGRVAHDAEPDEPTGPEHTEPDREAPEAAPEPSDQAAEPDAAWDEDVDDPPRPTGARFARQPRKRGRSAKAARRPAETGRAGGAESSRAPSDPAAVPGTPEPAGTVAPAAAHQATWPAYRPPARPETEPDEPAIDEPDGPDTAVRVRPYIHTGGRTRSRLPLPIESLVTATPDGSHHHLYGAHRSLVELCRTTQSVAEISAKLGVPLGVARVLVDDLVAARAVTVYGDTVGDDPDFALMERVLAGLRRL
ncbi:MAG: DUF742 domain-containing protein [Pseudonocardia sp.]